MRHKSHWIIILPVLLLSVAVSSVVVKSASDISGYYDFVGKAPKGFEDIDWISLVTMKQKQAARLTGFVRVDWRLHGRLVNFELVHPTLDDHTLTFSTKVVSGISYQFRGQFLKLENIKDHETVSEGAPNQITKRSENRRM